MHNPWLLVLTGEVSWSNFLDPTVRKCPFLLSEPPDSRWHLDLDLKVGFTELVFMQHDRDLHALGASSKDKWWLTKRYTVYGCIRYIYTPNSCFFLPSSSHIFRIFSPHSNAKWQFSHHLCVFPWFDEVNLRRGKTSGPLDQTMKSWKHVGKMHRQISSTCEGQASKHQKRWRYLIIKEVFI